MLDSRSVQTDGNSDQLVQISTSLQGLLQRISSYQRYKRFQLDISNQLEFCHNTCEFTCARTDVTHFRRSTKVNNVQTHDDKGPLGGPLLPLEQFQRSLHHEQTTVWDNKHTDSATINLLHIPQRLSNIEQYLVMDQQGGSKPKDLLTRVTQLEMQLLAVEGYSYEYNHSKVGSKSVPLSNAT